MSAPSSFITGISLIRIILCLMICAFHWARWSPVAGSVGVDWFIVLSGFLMTFTLKENSFSPPSFYISKFARLWPLLFTAILLSSLVSYKEQFQQDAEQVLDMVAGAAGFGAQFRQAGVDPVMSVLDQAVGVEQDPAPGCEIGLAGGVPGLR